jgi:hypothetical protein
VSCWEKAPAFAQSAPVPCWARDGHRLSPGRPAPPGAPHTRPLTYAPACGSGEAGHHLEGLHGLAHASRTPPCLTPRARLPVATGGATAAAPHGPRMARGPPRRGPSHAPPHGAAPQADGRASPGVAGAPPGHTARTRSTGTPTAPLRASRRWRGTGSRQGAPTRGATPSQGWEDLVAVGGSSPAFSSCALGAQRPR